jgi:Flp pilus assembly pilin Flp
MQRVQSVIQRFFRDYDGQDLVEYGLLVGLIGIFCVAALSAVGNTVSGTLWRFIAETPI